MNIEELKEIDVTVPIIVSEKQERPLMPIVNGNQQPFSIFENPKFGKVRVNIDNESPKFCLADVCSILGLTAKGVKQRLSDDAISTYPIIDTIGRTQSVLFVNEDGLYDVVMDSRKPEARQFRKWVTGEVLPSIRKTGAYVAATPEDSPEIIMARGMMAAKDALDRMEQRALSAENALQIAEPKIEYYNTVIENRDIYTTNQLASELGMSYPTLRAKLYALGIIAQPNGRLKLSDKFTGWGVEVVEYPRKSKALKWNKEGRKNILNAINPLIPA